MQFSTIGYQVDGQIARLTLRRPEVSNGFNIPMCEEILSAIQLTKENDAVVILQILAEGTIFSVGGDLVEMKRAVDED
ncbi:enoyl-CoA hydratase/isomerase family protein, partial [Streptococcus pyogenes]